MQIFTCSAHVSKANELSLLQISGSVPISQLRLQNVRIYVRIKGKRLDYCQSEEELPKYSESVES